MIPIVATRRAQAGAGTTTAQTLLGPTLATLQPPKKWRHPWHVRPLFVGGKWVASMKPGFVNGRCPIWRTTLKEQAAAPQDFGINPLTGKPYFSADVFDQGSAPAPEARQIDIPLYLEPAIALRWRALGWDGEGAVPKFFLDRGAADRPAASGRGATEPARPEGLRLLRACDLWVHQPRLAITSEFTIEPGLATGMSTASQRLGLRSAVPGDTLRVLSGRFKPYSRDEEPLELYGTLYSEPPWDELLIATVFLLSPPDAEPGSEPDGSWQPFVRHALFWPLVHVVPPFRQYDGNPDVPFIPPLAGGAGQIVINYLTSTVNDLLQQALNAVVRNSLAGTFYTATGGGHEAEFPVAAIPTTGAGLNQGARLRAEALAAARAKRAAKLDPDFPFRAVPFEPALLNPTT